MDYCMAVYGTLWYQVIGNIHKWKIIAFCGNIGFLGKIMKRIGFLHDFFICQFNFILSFIGDQSFPYLHLEPSLLKKPIKLILN